jgi:hypothetical protein
VLFQAKNSCPCNYIRNRRAPRTSNDAIRALILASWEIRRSFPMAIKDRPDTEYDNHAASRTQVRWHCEIRTHVVAKNLRQLRGYNVLNNSDIVTPL